MRTSLLAKTFAALLLTTAACGGEDPADPTTEVPDGGAPVIALELGEESARVIRNQTVEVAVVVERNDAATGPILVTAEDLPAGVSAAAVTIAEGEDSAVLALSAGAEIELGSQVTATIRASHGEAEAAAPIDLRLTDAPGALDLSFGEGGLVIDSFESAAHELITDLVIQPDGKVVVAMANLFGQTYSVARYTADGELDASFAGDGVFEIPTGGSYGSPRVALRADGSLLVGTPATGASAIYALDPSGALIESYGDAPGVSVLSTLTIGTTFGFGAMSVDADGAALIAGHSGGNFMVARLLPDGRRDQNFGTGGIATIDLGAAELAYAIVERPDGRILVAGASDDGQDRYGFAQLLPTGAFDPAFSQDGRLVVDVGASTQIYGAAGLADGRVVISAAAGGGGNLLVVEADARFESRATPGILASEILEVDGGLVLAGSDLAGKVAIARTSLDGAMDAGFGSAGVVAFDVLPSADRAFAAALDDAGRLVLGGTAEADDVEQGDVLLGRMWL